MWPEVHPNISEAFVNSKKVTKLVSTDELRPQGYFWLMVELGVNGMVNVLKSAVLGSSWLLLPSTAPVLLRLASALDGRAHFWPSWELGFYFTLKLPIMQCLPSFGSDTSQYWCLGCKQSSAANGFLINTVPPLVARGCSATGTFPCSSLQGAL